MKKHFGYKHKHEHELPDSIYFVLLLTIIANISATYIIIKYFL